MTILIVNYSKPESLTRSQICFLAHDIDVPMNIGSLFRIADGILHEKVLAKFIVNLIYKP